MLFKLVFTSNDIGVTPILSHHSYTIVIALWSHDIYEENKLHVPSSCADLVYFAVVTSSPNSIEETVNIVKQAAGSNVIKAVICGGEHGVPRKLILFES